MVIRLIIVYRSLHISLVARIVRTRLIGIETTRREVAAMSHTLSLPVVRFSLAGFFSLTATFFMFFFMESLIRPSGNIYVEDTGPVPEFDFVRLEKDTPVTPRKRVQPPPEVTDQPPVPPPETQIDPDDRSTRISFNELEKDIPIGPTNPDLFSISEGEMVPVLKVQPDYPRRAIVNGIEGFVVVEFTVTATGATRDIKVIDAMPENIFNQASVRATAKFKYKPRVVDGTPVEVTGVQNKFIFQLD